MKSKPWIDEVYQDHLATWEIPIDLNHWAQAESLIIAQEKADKKRRMLLWSLLLGIIAVLSILGWNQYIHSKPAEIKSITPEIEETAPSNANPEVAQLNDLKDLDNKQAEPNKTSIISKQPDISSPALSLKVNNESKIKSFRPNITAALHKGITNNNLISSDTRHIIEKPIAVKVDDHPSIVEESVLESKQESIVMDALTTHWKIADPSANRQLKIPATEFSDEPIQVKKSSWKENGVRMTLAQESGLQLSNPSIRHAGFEWFHQKSIRSGLFYGYSLGYKSNFNHSQYAEVITAFQFEGFSSKVQNFGIKPEWMNALYAQGNIGIAIKRNKLFLGIRPEFIFGTKGQVDRLSFKETTGIKDINQASISSVNKGWLQSGSLNDLSWTLSIGYEYRIMKKLGIGIQVDHSLKSIYRPLDPQITQRAAAAWNTGFRFSYILN